MLREWYWRLMLLLTPARPLHEATHMVVARPFARVEYDPETIEAVLDWHPQTPVVWVRLAHLAPTLVGLSVAWFVLTVLVLFRPPIPLDFTPETWTVLLVGTVVNWGIYSWPSYKDRHPFDST